MIMRALALLSLCAVPAEGQSVRVEAAVRHAATAYALTDGCHRLTGRAWPCVALTAVAGVSLEAIQSAHRANDWRAGLAWDATGLALWLAGRSK